MNTKTTPNTISIGTQIHNPIIMEAKAYLKENFGNKYDIEPHFNFIIMAMPDYRLKDLEQKLDVFFNKKTGIELKFGNLHFEEKQRFFSIPIINKDVMNIHKDLINLLNPIRDHYIREKDLVRIREGKTDELEERYIYDYGYLRVLERFIPHITIGNIKNEEFNLEEIKTRLDSILSNLYNTSLKVNELYATFIEDAEIQSDYKWIWEKTYILN